MRLKTKLLLEKVDAEKIYPTIKRKRENEYNISINKNKKDLNSDDLFELSSKIKYLIEFLKEERQKVNVRLTFEKVTDIPTFIIIEQLIYALINETDLRVHLFIKTNENYTLNNYLKNSPLVTTLDFTTKEVIKDTYNAKLESFNINQISHCQMRINFKKTDEQRISRFSQDVGNFLKNLNIAEEVIYNVRDMFAELNINMLEHGKTDFTSILQVDETLKHKTEAGNLISITVFNTSAEKLYSPLKKIIQKKMLLVEQSKLYTALDYHQKYFNQGYNQEDFLMISAFQRNISSRIGKNQDSGTGLTTVVRDLLKNINVQDNNQYSYVLSGDRILKFKKDTIKESEINNIHQIGFNKSGRYLDDIPSRAIIDRTSYYYNGTLFYMRLFIPIEREIK